MLNFLSFPRLDHGGKLLVLMDSTLLCASGWLILRPASRLAPWLRIPPLAAAVMMVGPSWLANDLMGSTGVLLRRVFMLLLVGGILFGTRLLNRYRDWGPSSHLAGTLALLLVTVGASAMVSGRNRLLPPTPAHLAADPGLPPVVLVTFDTTRADHMSLYGYPRKTTPSLEDFARHATVYRDAVAASDWTLPSHGSIFTGTYPSWHGARSYAGDPPEIIPLQGTHRTLAEVLRDRGVFTVGVAANKAFLSPEWGLGRGFQSFNVQHPVEVLQPNHSYYLRSGIRRILACCVETMGFDQSYRRAEAVNADAIGALEDKAVRDRSFFLFVNYMDAHWPYVSPVPEGAVLPTGHGAPTYEELMDIFDKVNGDHVPFPEPARSRILERYDAGIATEDAALEDLLQWLKRRGLYDRALIIVTSDHGEAFGEHSQAGHGLGTYQDQVDVPLVIKYPHQSEGRVVRGLVSHVDILPTVLDTLGIPAPPEIQGISLRDPGDLSGRSVFIESFPMQPLTRRGLVQNRVEEAIRSGPYKLTISNRGKHDLFNVKEDSGELHNLTARNIPEVAALDAALREWTSHIPAQKPAKPVTDEQMKRLRGLGYVR